MSGVSYLELDGIRFPQVLLVVSCWCFQRNEGVKKVLHYFLFVLELCLSGLFYVWCLPLLVEKVN